MHSAHSAGTLHNPYLTHTLSVRSRPSTTGYNHPAFPILSPISPVMARISTPPVPPGSHGGASRHAGRRSRGTSPVPSRPTVTARPAAFHLVTPTDRHGAADGPKGSSGPVRGTPADSERGGIADIVNAPGGCHGLAWSPNGFEPTGAGAVYGALPSSWICDFRVHELQRSSALSNLVVAGHCGITICTVAR